MHVLALLKVVFLCFFLKTEDEAEKKKEKRIGKRGESWVRAATITKEWVQLDSLPLILMTMF